MKIAVSKMYLKSVPLLAALVSANASALTIMQFEFVGQFSMYAPGGLLLAPPSPVLGNMTLAIGSSLLGPFNGLASMYGTEPFVGYNWTANGGLTGYQNLSGNYAPAYCGTHDMCADASLDFSWGGTTVPVDASFAMDLDDTLGTVNGWSLWAAIVSAYNANTLVNFDVASLDADGDGLAGTAITAPIFTGFTPYFTGKAYLRNICVSSTLTASDQCTAPAVVPVPAAIWLFGSGMLGLIGLARRQVA